MRTDDLNKSYYFLTNTFINIINKYAPLKNKFTRGSQAPFISRNLRKEIYTRSKFRNKFCKNAIKGYEKLYKKQRNKCAELRGEMYKRMLSQSN